MAKVLVVGAGGREHALAEFLARSPAVRTVYTAPGNAGTPNNVPIDASTPSGFSSLAEFLEEQRVDLTVVGSEAPLCAGLGDFLRERKQLVFGPSQRAARLESDKAFARQFMRRHGIPHPSFEIFTSPSDAVRYVQSLPGGPIVVKACGLAQGKGVFVCEDRREAESSVRALMVERQLGAAGEAVVIEEFAAGEEATVTAISDGHDVAYLPSSQDHKRAYDGDRGPNTGGMGTYAPAPIVTPKVLERVDRLIVRPTLEGMVREGAPFCGCLYVGLMIRNGDPTVIEYNCRFGDPEAQPILPVFEGDFYGLLHSVAMGRLEAGEMREPTNAATCVVLTSGGYPGKYEVGKPIHGIEEAAELPNVYVYHAGTRRSADGTVVTSGGRVLGITGVGLTLREATDRAYAAAGKVSFEGCHYRRDIAQRALLKMT